MNLYSSFQIVHIDDDKIILTDMDIGMTVTNDAENVVCCLDKIVSGGIKERKVYYRDTNLIFD